MSYRALQHALVARGFDPGPVDGKWGPRTAAAYDAADRAVPASQPLVNSLNLADEARGPALHLRLEHPAVIFTSGRRGIRDQARAMSQNVAKNRRWIAETYTPTAQSQQLQLALNRRPDVTTAAQIEALLYDVLREWTDEDLAKLSSHLAGRAFDVQPVAGAVGDRIKATLYLLTDGVGKFLEREGGLVRWHAQFKAAG